MKFIVNNIILVAITAACLLGAWFFGQRSYNKFVKWERAEGQLMHWMKKGDYNSDPRIKFTYEGKEYNFVEKGYKEDKSVQVSIGARWEVIFPKEAPQKAELRRFGMLLGLPAGLGVAGILLLLAVLTKIYRAAKGLKEPTVEEVMEMRRLQREKNQGV